MAAEAASDPAAAKQPSPAAAPAASTSYSTDPALYIYTSLTAGSSHIVTATSRLETILRANRVPFKATDLATDDKARMLWGRRAGKDESGRPRKLPGLVQMGLVLGDLVEIEDWNEYGELKQHVTIYYDEHTQPSIHNKPKTPPPRAKPKSAVPAATAAAAHAAAPPAPPPPPPAAGAAKPTASSASQPKTAAAAVAETVSKVTMPIRSIAEEAAAKAKQVQLQSLRDKVYGKGGKKDEGSDGDAAKKETAGAEQTADKEGAAPPATPPSKSKTTSSISLATSSSASLATTRTAPGLQSPTTGTWKVGEIAAPGAPALHTVQSPTSTSWKPTDVDAPITTLQGARVASVSQEEIQAVEKAETIKEESEEDDEDDDDDEDEEESSEEEESSDEEEEENEKDTKAKK